MHGGKGFIDYQMLLQWPMFVVIYASLHLVHMHQKSIEIKWADYCFVEHKWKWRPKKIMHFSASSWEEVNVLPNEMMSRSWNFP